MCRTGLSERKAVRREERPRGGDLQPLPRSQAPLLGRALAQLRLQMFDKGQRHGVGQLTLGESEANLNIVQCTHICRPDYRNSAPP